MKDPEAMTEVVFVDETLQEVLVFEYFSGTDDIKLFSFFFRLGKLERSWPSIFGSYLNVRLQNFQQNFCYFYLKTKLTWISDLSNERHNKKLKFTKFKSYHLSLRNISLGFDNIFCKFSSLSLNNGEKIDPRHIFAHKRPVYVFEQIFKSN